jgi:integrase/recombinase XerC
MLTNFLKYLQLERNYSVQTIRAYGDDLRQFFSYCGIDSEANNFSEINHRIIRAWLSHLIAHKHSPRSVNRKLSSIRSYYKYLLKKGFVLSSPLSKVVAPKNSKKLPVFITENEANNLLDRIKFSDDFNGLRDFLVLELFYFTGVRVSELINLTLNNVDLNGSTIKVLGKGSKERLIPIHPELQILLIRYLKEREEVFPSNLIPFLIVNNNGKKSYPQLIYRLVNKYLSMVTSLDKKSPHVLRHTFATHLLNNGADINAIKELLGHSNLSATQVYTHTSIDKLKSAYKQAHPRA